MSPSPTTRPDADRPSPPAAAAPPPDASHTPPPTHPHTDAHPDGPAVRVAYPALLDWVAGVLGSRGLPADRARDSARALCHGDLTGFTTHGLTNLARLYLPLLDSGRCDPAAEPEIVNDAGASVLLDARRALGLWAAGRAMDLAVRRARSHGIGMVSVRGGTHFGCAGHHALRAVDHEMIGVATANCGRQGLAPPVGGATAMLGTNPLALAAPGGAHPPFSLDMSTTVVPTGRIRAAARAGETVPAGWLEDPLGTPVTDPAAYDRGEARLRWLGGDPDTGAYKGYGLGLLVEILSALLPGAGLGPTGAQAAGGTRDDDIGYLLLAVAPSRLRPLDGFLTEADGMFGALLDCPPLDADRPVRYPGWWEHHRSEERRRDGVPLAAGLHRELLAVADDTRLPFPAATPEGAA